MTLVAPEQTLAQRIAERLRVLMADRGLNQTTLAEAIGIRQPTVSAYLAGDSVPGGEVVASICDRFSVSADWILARTDVRLPPAWIFHVEEFDRFRSGLGSPGSPILQPLPPDVRVVSEEEAARIRQQLHDIEKANVASRRKRPRRGTP